MNWLATDKDNGSSRVPGTGMGWLRRASYGLSNAGRVVLPWLMGLLLALLIMAPLIMLAWLILFTDTFTIRATNVVDARDHTAQAIKELIEKELDHAAFNRNIFFVATDALASSAMKLPQVRTVHIQRKLPSTIVVTVQEKTPVLLLASGGDYYFVDETGVPYEEARLETLPEVVLPTVKNDERGAAVPLGAGAVDPSFVSFVQEVQEKIPDFTGSHVVEIHIPALRAREVYFILDNNWEIKFDVTRSAQPQLAVLQRLLQEALPEADRAALEYVDLRIPDRVYYKTR